MRLGLGCALKKMERAAAGAKAKVSHEYERVFQTLGVDDPAKVQTLARLLQVFCEVASQLDSYLAPVGASLHAAVSRMCEGDNPLAPPQHRWIRVIDRLGFFRDTDEHTCRVVNIGLSNAYRHKELEALTAANALRLCDLRLSTSGGGGDGGTPLSQRCVPPGGVVVPRPVGLGGTNSPARVAQSRSASDATVVGGASVRDPSADDGSSILPPGGLVVKRPGTVGGTKSVKNAGGVLSDGDMAQVDRETVAKDPAPDGDEDALLQDGGIVVARRAPLPDLPAGQDGVGSSGAGNMKKTGAVVELDGEFVTVISSTQPVVTHTDAAVKCVTSVLDSLASRDDVHRVLDQLVCESLLSLRRLHGGSVANYSAGVVSANL